jgi:16S rRNA (guanine527-N7)-methyltransferase
LERLLRWRSELELIENAAYEERGLDGEQIRQLAVLGELLLGSQVNVTAIREPRLIERLHFLDSLSLLDLPEVADSAAVVDIGSGAGLPALVLAIARRTLAVTAVESVHKKCEFMQRAISVLGIENVTVVCSRAEDFGRWAGRGRSDIAVSRALAALPVVAELSFPLLREGGRMVALKGAISDQERIQGERALGILGGSGLKSVRLHPFPGAENHWAYISQKARATPERYPRRAGVPNKRPLGEQ